MKKKKKKKKLPTEDVNMRLGLRRLTVKPIGRGIPFWLCSKEQAYKLQGTLNGMVSTRTWCVRGECCHSQGAFSNLDRYRLGTLDQWIDETLSPSTIGKHHRYDPSDGIPAWCSFARSINIAFHWCIFINGSTYALEEVNIQPTITDTK